MPVAHGGQTLVFYEIKLIETCLGPPDSFNPDSAKILNDGTSTSNGSTTSIPYTNENGVASVDVCPEVR